MSPEQCEGKGLIDHRSDVYSLGIVMYELLTGVVPFPGEGFGEVLVAHLTKEAVKPTVVNPNLPPAIESIVLHAIEKDRNRRFQNMQEFLAAVENPEAHAAQWSGLPGTRRRRRGRRRCNRCRSSARAVARSRSAAARRRRRRAARRDRRRSKVPPPK